MAWNAGYVTDVNYTFGYYAELNPNRITQALKMAGVAPPQIRHACELGFGQGVSAAIHAATQPRIEWWGTDFNPSQAAFARHMAAASGSNARFFDQSFVEFCARDDLPMFDLISLHGIWSWISDENRTVIVDFLRRRLAVGGVLYISYNTLPGWAAAAPLRHLMKQHADHHGSGDANIVGRIDDALGFMEQMLNLQPAYVRNNPIAVERFKAIKEQDRQYLAHEYMNRDWRPMYVAEMQEWLEPAKLSYAGGVALLEQQDQVNLTVEQIAFLATIKNPNFKETVRDFMTGQQFRRDLWVRGPRRLPLLDQAEAVRDQRYILTLPRADVPLKAKGLQGEVDLQGQIYNPLLEVLADNQIKSFHEIEQAMAARGINFGQTANALAVLSGMGVLSPVQEDQEISEARPTAERLNNALVSRARADGDVSFLASPVVGGGVAVNRLDQILLLARSQGRRTIDELIQYQTELLASQGQSILKNGRRLADPAEIRAELEVRHKVFDKRLPILKALGIA